MKEKLCRKCNTIKPYSEYSRCSRTKTGIQSKCKECEKLYREENRERINKYLNQYYSDNSEKLKQLSKEYVIKNWEEVQKRKATWYLKNKDRVVEGIKERLQKNPLELKKKQLRGLVMGCIKAKNPSTRTDTLTYKILGCTAQYFKKHIESQFLNWMGWDNYGTVESSDFKERWYLDHIVPLSHAKNKSEMEELCHYSNIQPMCRRRNKVKNNTLPILTNLFNNKTYGL